jgi:hypothetical protein
VAAVKKVVIPRSQLIPVDGLGQALVRFRIISDDRNRFSEWSSIFAVTSTEVLDTLSINSRTEAMGSIIMTIWSGLPANTPIDIFISDDGGPMTYDATSSDNRHNFILSAENTYQVSGQISSIRKVYDPSLQIFESEVFDVV